KVVLTGTGHEIDLSNLNNGIYFVTVKSGTEVIAVKKLIKE
ncbi:MAG: T9SS type A sorting domain-containing protein, partial [Bacteroidia bacterium]